MLDQSQIRRPSIENQIESMLDKIMDEESFSDQQEKLEFSDDESEKLIDITFPDSNSTNFANQFRNNYHRAFTNVPKPQSLFGKSSINGLNNTMNDQLQWNRLNKRYQTVSFNNNNELPNVIYYDQCYPPIDPMSVQPFYGDTNYCSYISNTSSIDDYCQRSDFRRNTDEEIQRIHMNTPNVVFLNSSFAQNTNANNISVNSMNNSSFMISQGINQASSPSNSTSSFNSAHSIRPRSNTDIKLELMWLELSKNLSKIEKFDHFIFNKLQNQIQTLLKTHKGSKLFQTYLPNTQSEIIHLIFNEIRPNLTSLMQNPYANYFCKLLFTWLNQKARIEFLKSIQPCLVKLSMDSIGTYPWQSIIEWVGSKLEKKVIVSEISNSLTELVWDVYGTHVLEKICTYFEEEFVLNIYDYICNNFMFLAFNSNGICLVKKILSFTHKKDWHETLKSKIMENSFQLIQHQYGNYIIQSVIDYWEDIEIEEICAWYTNKFAALSLQKYSSNVVERIIEKSGTILNRYITEVVESKNIYEIMKNNYGNYVIQKAVKLASGEIKKRFIEVINLNICKLNDKKLMFKWSNIIYSSCNNNNNNNNNINNDNIISTSLNAM